MAKRKLAPLPRITAKTITVKALLMQIRQLILDEPKRLNMGRWVESFRGEKVDADADRGAPACGTIACMAGWGAVLLRPDRSTGWTLYNNAKDVMTRLVGFNRGYGWNVNELFSGVNSLVYGEFSLPEAGTEEHATVIASRIDAYMAQHPEILKRRIDVASARRMLNVKR